MCQFRWFLWLSVKAGMGNRGKEWGKWWDAGNQDWNSRNQGGNAGNAGNHGGNDENAGNPGGNARNRDRMRWMMVGMQGIGVGMWGSGWECGEFGMGIR